LPTLNSVSLSALLITLFNVFTASFIPSSIMTFLYHAHAFSLQCHSFYLYVTNSPLCLRYLCHLIRRIGPLLFPLSRTDISVSKVEIYPNFTVVWANDLLTQTCM
jgi:hypothetical protein